MAYHVLFFAAPMIAGLAAVTGLLEIAFDTSSFSLIVSAAGSRLLSRGLLIREKLPFFGEWRATLSESSLTIPDKEE